MLTAAIYARKSNDQTGIADDAKSVARQIDHARQYAAAKGWTVADEHVYADDAVSGAEFERRPGFVALMNALRPRPAFGVLVMSEESRLGREMLQTGYALYQLAAAGVRVFYYLDDRERTLDSPTDKILVSLQGFADELERERARQRTFDALKRKAIAGHVTGGRVFGFKNIEHATIDTAGRRVRQHVTREILEPEAAVVRRIFRDYARGVGLRTLTHQLNAEGLPAPRSQQGRPSGWALSSVREVLKRTLYRGVITWNRTRKRNAHGRIAPHARPSGDWLTVDAPDLRIVDDVTWYAVQARFRQRSTFRGRPPGVGSKYLLTGLLKCECGSGFEAVSWKTGAGRSWAYGCSAHRRRGPTVCANNLRVPMALADRTVLAAVLTHLLTPAIIIEAIARAATTIEREHDGPSPVAGLEQELGTVQAELARLSTAIAAGGDVPTLLEAVQARERRRRELTAAIAEQATRVRPRLDRVALRASLRSSIRDWRALLRSTPPAGQQALRALIVDRLVLTPRHDGNGAYYAFSGLGTVAPIAGAILTGDFNRMVRPHSVPTFCTNVPIRGEMRLAV